MKKILKVMCLACCALLAVSCSSKEKAPDESEKKTENSEQQNVEIDEKTEDSEQKSAGDEEKPVEVEQKPVELEKIVSDRTFIIVPIGETEQIVFTAMPKGAVAKDVEYLVKNTEIATVDENGVLTGVKVGNTSVTVTAENDTILEYSVVVVNPDEIYEVCADENVITLDAFASKRSLALANYDCELRLTREGIDYNLYYYKNYDETLLQKYIGFLISCGYELDKTDNILTRNGHAVSVGNEGSVIVCCDEQTTETRYNELVTMAENKDYRSIYIKYNSEHNTYKDSSAIVNYATAHLAWNFDNDTGAMGTAMEALEAAQGYADADEKLQRVKAFADAYNGSYLGIDDKNENLYILVRDGFVATEVTSKVKVSGIDFYEYPDPAIYCWELMRIECTDEYLNYLGIVPENGEKVYAYATGTFLSSGNKCKELLINEGEYLRCFGVSEAYFGGTNGLDDTFNGLYEKISDKAPDPLEDEDDDK